MKNNKFNYLIQTNDNKEVVVSCKELYLELGLTKQNWSTWYKTNITNNTYLTENTDYDTKTINVRGNVSKDFIIKTKKMYNRIKTLCIITSDRYKNTKNNYKTYIVTDQTGYYKIGKTIDIERRVNDFIISNLTIELVHVINKNIESKLHKKYKDKNISGEWFNLSKEDIDYLKTI